MMSAARIFAAVAGDRDRADRRCPRRRARRSTASKSRPRPRRPAATRTSRRTSNSTRTRRNRRRREDVARAAARGRVRQSERGRQSAPPTTSRSSSARPTPRSGVVDRPRQLRRRRKNPARDGAGLRHGVASRRRDGPLRLHRAGRQHPDQHPDPGPDRERLRPDDDRDRDQPGDPARRSRHQRSGASRRSTNTTTNASSRARPATRPAARARRAAAARPTTARTRTSRRLQIAPLTDNPTICTGEPAAGEAWTSPPTRTKTHPSHAGGAVPGDDRLRPARPSIRSSTRR